jgi:hypothetical protein
MTRDATFLFALVMLATAALVVGVSGWVLFAREHRAAKPTAWPIADDHPRAPEDL